MSGRLLGYLIFFAWVVLHQDFWNWSATEPLLFGWMPLALWYHVLYGLLGSPVLYIFLKLVHTPTEKSFNQAESQESE